MEIRNYQVKQDNDDGLWYVWWEDRGVVTRGYASREDAINKMMSLAWGG